MKNLSLLVLVFGLTVSVSSFAAGGMGGPGAAPVVVAKVQEKELAPNSVVAGTVVGRLDARLAAEQAGRLIWVAEVGETFKEEDVVAKLDDTQMKLQLKELHAIVKKERARLRFNEKEVARWQKLAKQDVAAMNRLEQSQSERDVAKGELQAAQARLQVMKDQLHRMQIRAPYNGVVSQRFRTKGEWVKSGDEVIRFIDPQALEAQARIPISALPFVKPGMAIRLFSGKESSLGQVRTLVPVGDERSRLLELRIELADVVWPVGQSVRIAVPSGHPKRVLTAPRDALVLRRSGTVVYTIGEENKAQRIEVVTGIADGTNIEIKGQVKVGDKVVVRGGERLRPGQSVKVVEAQAIQ